jgi:hypothetical protein
MVEIFRLLGALFRATFISGLGNLGRKAVSGFTRSRLFSRLTGLLRLKSVEFELEVKDSEDDCPHPSEPSLFILRGFEQRIQSITNLKDPDYREYQIGFAQQFANRNDPRSIVGQCFGNRPADTENCQCEQNGKKPCWNRLLRKALVQKSALPSQPKGPVDCRCDDRKTD